MHINSKLYAFCKLLNRLRIEYFLFVNTMGMNFLFLMALIRHFQSDFATLVQSNSFLRKIITK